MSGSEVTDQVKGHAVQVISLVDRPPTENGEDKTDDSSDRMLKLDTQVFREIMKKAGDHPLVVLAIAGASRGGKSFMMTYFVRYLSALEKAHQTNGEVGDWMEKSNPNLSMKEKGFQFQNGCEQVTEGIWMWSRPFIVGQRSNLKQSSGTENNDKKSIAIILMDTEGCFGEYSSEQEQFSIIGLSLLSSSCFIFNETSKINDCTLNSLAKFMHYGQLATQKQCEIASFQRLVFLVRDWTMPDSYDYGGAGGKCYVTEKILKCGPRMSKQAVEIRQSIKNSFEDINCYLMPNPGSTVLSKEFRGSVGEMPVEFQNHVEHFVTSLIEDVDAKKVDTRLFYELFSQYVKEFNSAEIPSPESIIQISTKIQLISSINKLRNAYEDALKTELATQKFLLPSDIIPLHKLHKTITISEFNRKRHLGSPSQELVDSFRKTLDLEIEESLLKILTDYENGRKPLIDSAIEACSQKFDLSMNEELCSQKLWTALEFEEVSMRATSSALQKLNVALDEPPKPFLNSLLPSILTNLQRIKDDHWKDLESVKEGIVQKIEILKKEAMNLYEGTMKDILSSDDNSCSYLPPKVINSHHEIYERMAVKSFGINIRPLDLPPNSIESFVQELKSELHQMINKLLEENEQRMVDMETKLNGVILEATQLFQQDAQEILDEANNSAVQINVEKGLRTLYEQILELGREDLFENEKLLDQKMHKQYLNKLEMELKNCLEESLKNFEESESRKTIQWAQIFQEGQQQFFKGVESIIDNENNTTTDKYIEPSILQDKMVKLAGEVQQFCEEKVENLNSKNSQKFLQELYNFLQMENDKITLKNDEKVTMVCQRVEESVKIHRKFYVDEILSTLKFPFDSSGVSIENLEQHHQRFAQKALQKLNADLSRCDSPVLHNARKNLSESLDVEFQNLNRNLEEQQKFLQSISSTSKLTYKNEIDNFLKVNPFYNDQDFELLHDELWNKIQSKFLAQIKNNLPSCFQTYNVRRVDLMQHLENELTPHFQEMHQVAENSRERGFNQATEILDDCIDYFFDNFTSSEAGDLEETFQEVKRKTEQQFLASWNSIFPCESSAQEKEKFLVELRAKMLRQFSKMHGEIAEEETFSQETYRSAQRLIESGLKNLENELEAGKIYKNSKLDEILEESRENLAISFKQELKNQCQTLNKMLSEKQNQNFLQNFILQFESKCQEVLSKNLENSKKLKRKTAEVAQSLLQTMAGLVKNEASFRKETTKIFQQTMEKIEHEFKIKIQDGDFPELDEEIKETVDDLANSILQNKQRTEKKNTEYLMETAVKIYQQEMNSHLAGETSVHPDNLDSFHLKSLEHCQMKLECSTFLFQDQLDAIFERLEKSFILIQQKNNLHEGQKDNLAVGIDLGTTTSAVAVYQQGKARVLKDGNGHNLIPSYVYYPENPGLTKLMVGQEAKKQAHQYPDRTVFDAKRLIGRPFSDPIVQRDIRTWPFQVTGDDKDRPKIVIGTEKLDPEEISAQVLRKMKQIATDALKTEVKKAVITVPASFNDGQREATRHAAVAAGLEVLQIINEPTAAAMAYALNWKDEDKIFLVFDLGGGTFDVSILQTGCGKLGESSAAQRQDPDEDERANSTAIIPASKEDDEGGAMGTNLKVLTTLGDSHLGGEDFDSNMIDFFATEFENAEGVPLLVDDNNSSNSQTVKRRLRRLRNECERVKEALSAADSATASLDAIVGGIDLHIEITKAQFEAMNESLFQKTIDTVQKALDDANLKKREVDEVIMVGGSSRIPRVQQLLQEFFKRPALCLDQKIDIQEAVALGAAVQACILNGGSTIKNLPKVRDLQPHSLGIETFGGKMSVIIPRNTPIPCRLEETYETVYADQATVKINIYSGEQKSVPKNNKLGGFLLSGIPPGKKGSQKIDVSMAIDDSGILKVTGIVVSNGVSQNLTIEENRGRLSVQEIDRMRRRLQAMSS